MIATDRGRVWRRILLVATTAVVPSLARAQGQPAPQAGARGARGPVQQAQAQAQAQQQAQAQAQQAGDGEPRLRLQRDEKPRLVPTAIPVNPTDAIALVNGEPITRAQLADECIIRKGNEILDTLIARKLIEQELHRRKVDVSQSEIDHEIEDIAYRLGGGLSREAWLRTLDKERGISPAQYARDIIYPTIALRKLAAGRVQVTADDMKRAFEAHFGPRLHCRIITVDTQAKAIQIWEELRKNPGSFANLAKLHSTDQATRALGGYLSEPIARHAHPLNVSEPAFKDLVDGDAKDRDPGHKPKDGDFTGPIQVNEVCWIIIKREAIDPAKDVDANDKMVRTQLEASLRDAKLKDAMTTVFEELTEAAAIDNRLTGTFKEANEKKDPAYQEAKDREVKLMGGQRPADKPAPAPAGATAPRANITPVGVPGDVADQARRLSQPIAPKQQP